MKIDRKEFSTSHDLKAPLRAIESLSTWIEQDHSNNLTQESKENLILLRQRVKRMGNLISGILQYSRAGSVDKDIYTVSIKELLNEIIDNFKLSTSIAIHSSDNLPTLQTYSIQLRQVYSNLISNSIKYHDRPDGHIEIGVKDAGEFYVTDDGPGIDPEFHKKIFEIFQTLQSQDIIESTGIGLAIVKKIVESHGGNIMVDSNKGKGATFRFTWPKESHADKKQISESTVVS